MTGGQRLADEELDPTLAEPPRPVYRCGGYDYHLDIWETTPTNPQTGQVPMLYHYCGIILVYDLSSPHSWDEAVRLRNVISDSRPIQDGEQDKTSPSALQVMILGLKADIQGGCWVPRHEREDFARQHGSIFAECSARTGEGLHEAIGAFVEQAHETITRNPESFALHSMDNRKGRVFKALYQAADALRTEPSSLPDLCQKGRWLDLVKQNDLPGKGLDLRGGTMCIALWVAPGGNNCLRDMVRTQAT